MSPGAGLAAQDSKAEASGDCVPKRELGNEKTLYDVCDFVGWISETHPPSFLSVDAFHLSTLPYAGTFFSRSHASRGNEKINIRTSAFCWGSFLTPTYAGCIPKLELGNEKREK